MKRETVSGALLMILGALVVVTLLAAGTSNHEHWVAGAFSVALYLAYEVGASRQRKRGVKP